MVIFQKKQKAKILTSYLIVLVILSLIPNNTVAQSKRIAIWHVGNKRLDFNTKPVTITEIKDENLFGKGFYAILCDKEGKLLLFCSNGNLYDKNYKKISDESVSGNMFIPKPNSDSLVYLMSAAAHYTLINIKNHKVVGKGNLCNNTNLDSTGCFGLCAVSHSNCNDIWLIANGTNRSLRSYLLTSKGFSKNYVKQKNKLYFHRTTLSPTGKYYCGSIYDGRIYADSRYDSTRISFGIFNNTTGLFTQTYSKLFMKGFIHGIAFSPNESKLYLHFMCRKQMELYQVDIANGVPNFDNAILINKEAHSGLGAREFTPMQLGLDGKIYKTFIFKKRRIDIIHHPNMKGKACGFQANAIRLSTLGNTLPKFVCSYAAKNPCELSFYSQNFCYSDYTMFNILNTDNIKSVVWHFGDGSSSTELHPEHYYSSEGEYIVTLQTTYTDNTIQTETQTINIIYLKELDIKQE